VTMRLIKGVQALPQFTNGCVATIGNFDGVHLGHRSIIRELAEEGRRRGLAAVVVLFEPQPLEYFRPADAPPRLTRLREKLACMRDLPVDAVLLLRFTPSFAAMQPEVFIQKILVEGLRVKHLLIGDDFRFGRQRSGDYALLRAVSAASGFDVADTQSIQFEGVRVSSTLIRETLMSSNMALATRLLGRPYFLCGRVIEGNKLGRSLGFPTANMRVFRKTAPISGVFAVTMSGIAAQPVSGVANIGVRPTLGGREDIRLETHLFDFDANIYGNRVAVYFHHKIRDEQRFQDISALKKQIEQDVLSARAYFAHHATNPLLTAST
jgi:riboflavin kinase / FMN adenylyltransferase